MPKLNANMKKKTAAAEEISFEPIPDGIYVLKLAEDVEVREGGKGDYWNLKLKVVGPEHAGRIVFTRLFPNSEKPGAFGIIKSFFKAVGVDLDEVEATEDVVGITFRARVGHETQTQGAGAGNVNNTIKGYLPKDEEAEAALLGDDEDDDEDPAPRPARGRRRAAVSELFDE